MPRPRIPALFQVAAKNTLPNAMDYVNKSQKSFKLVDVEAQNIEVTGNEKLVVIFLASETRRIGTLEYFKSNNPAFQKMLNDQLSVLAVEVHGSLAVTPPRGRFFYKESSYLIKPEGGKIFTHFNLLGYNKDPKLPEYYQKNKDEVKEMVKAIAPNLDYYAGVELQEKRLTNQELINQSANKVTDGLIYVLANNTASNILPGYIAHLMQNVPGVLFGDAEDQPVQSVPFVVLAMGETGRPKVTVKRFKETSETYQKLLSANPQMSSIVIQIESAIAMNPRGRGFLGEESYVLDPQTGLKRYVHYNILAYNGEPNRTETIDFNRSEMQEFAETLKALM